MAILARDDDDFVGARTQGGSHDGLQHGNVVDALEELV
jgi:hypothetical protein